MKELLLILIFTSFCKLNVVFATAQVSDYLILDNDTLAIEEFPLEAYFENHQRPDSVLSFQNTSNYRGYIGYWKIENDKLYLEKLVREFDEEVNLAEIFKDRDTSNNIFADWYNCSIISNYGKIIYQKYDIISPIYEHERKFVFKNGVVTDQYVFDNTNTKISRYSTDFSFLYEFISENIDYSNISSSTKNRKVYVRIDSVSSEGKIEKVKIIKGIDDKINAEAIRVIKKIPEWSVYYKHGEQVYFKTVLPILFNRKL